MAEKTVFMSESVSEKISILKDWNVLWSRKSKTPLQKTSVCKPCWKIWQRTSKLIYDYEYSTELKEEAISTVNALAHSISHITTQSTISISRDSDDAEVMWHWWCRSHVTVMMRLDYGLRSASADCIQASKVVKKISKRVRIINLCDFCNNPKANGKSYYPTVRSAFKHTPSLHSL